MKLRAIRAGLGHLSQGELIERLGLTDYINPSEISAFERGVREPDLLTLKAYADIAGISTDDLINDDGKLPKKLPGAGQTGGANRKPQKKQAKAVMNTTTVTLWLLIESDEGAGRSEKLARRIIEKNYLERYGMKQLRNDMYDLTFFHEDDADLDDQVYTLLGAIYIEAMRRKCSIKVNVRKDGGESYW
jgi:transcriptional regulator with XRE-family HTH domain